MKKVLFLYGNRPEPLPIHIMQLLGNTGKYRVELLYWDRGDSPVSLPPSGLLAQMQSSAIVWPVGNNIGSKLVNRGIVLSKFVRSIKAIQPDIIHAWNFDMLLAARVAALLSGPVDVVFTLQDTTAWMTSPRSRFLQRWAYRVADLIFVTSHGFETHFLRRFHLVTDEQQIVFVPNAPPAQQFTAFEPRRPGNVLTIGCIGLLRGSEGIGMLVRAATMARKMGANVRVLFAGMGPERELVERFAAQNPFVDYLGPYQYEQIHELYRAVDCLYAIYERSYDKQIHLAYRLCEAVNCRLPTIVAQGTHMSDIVEAYGIGVSVELGDVEGLANELVELWRSHAKRARIAMNCEGARPQFTFETYQSRILEAYGQLWHGARNHTALAELEP